MNIENAVINKTRLKIKIFEPLSNKNWLEEKVNLWLSENDIDVKEICMTYSDDKYIFTILYNQI
jgi:hypothetical protein